MPAAASPCPRALGATHTPCTWQASRVTAPTSALKTTRPSSIRPNARPGRDQLGDPRAVAAAPPPASGETPTSSVNIATHGRQQRCRARRAAHAAPRVGVDERRRRPVTISGWCGRTSRAGPHAGSSSSHSGSDVVGRADDRGAARPMPAGPVGERGDGLARWPPTGTRLAPSVAAPTRALAVDAVAPHLAAEAPRVEPAPRAPADRRRRARPGRGRAATHELRRGRARPARAARPVRRGASRPIRRSGVADGASGGHVPSSGDG